MKKTDLKRELPQLEEGVPLPTSGQGWITDLSGLLGAMKPGQSFITEDNKTIYRAAKKAGCRVRLHKLDGAGFRCWKLKGAR